MSDNKITTMAKVTIQMVDVTSPFLNTSIVEIDEIPMDNATHANLINFLIQTKTPEEEVVADKIVMPEDK